MSGGLRSAMGGGLPVPDQDLGDVTHAIEELQGLGVLLARIAFALEALAVMQSDRLAHPDIDVGIVERRTIPCWTCGAIIMRRHKPAGARCCACGMDATEQKP